MDCETECFQTSIFMLQQQLAIAKTTISELSNELEKHCPGRGQAILNDCNWTSSTKEEQMEGIEYVVDQDINGSPMNCPINHLLSESLDNVDHQLNSDLPLKLDMNFHPANEINCKLESVDDRTTKNDNSDLITTQILEPSSNYHSPLMHDADDHKLVTNDSETNNILTKKHSVKSNSAFNQKKLTSS